MILTNSKLRSEPNFLDPIEEVEILRDTTCVDLFDQNGYHLTKAEQAFQVIATQHKRSHHEEILSTSIPTTYFNMYAKIHKTNKNENITFYEETLIIQAQSSCSQYALIFF